MKRFFFVILLATSINVFTTCSQAIDNDASFDVKAKTCRVLDDMEAKIRNALVAPNPDEWFLRETFLIAIRYNHRKTIDLFLQFPSVTNIEWADSEGRTALMLACACGFEDLAELLIQHGANVNAKDAEGGISVLNCACHNSNIKLANLLLKNGARINQVNKFGLTVIGMMALAENSAMVDFLLQAGADINYPRSATPLMAAMERGNEELVNFLLKNNANPLAVDGIGRSALWYAVKGKNIKMVELALELGCDPNQEDCHGLTPCIACLATGDVEILKLMIKRGANVNQRSSQEMFKEFSLLRCAVREAFYEAVEILLQSGAQMATGGSPFATELVAAINNGKATKQTAKKILKLILENAPQEIINIAKRIEANELNLQTSFGAPVHMDLFYEVMNELGLSDTLHKKENEKEIKQEMDAAKHKQPSLIDNSIAMASVALGMIGGYCLINKFLKCEQGTQLPAVTTHRNPAKRTFYSPNIIIG